MHVPDRSRSESRTDSSTTPSLEHLTGTAVAVPAGGATAPHARVRLADAVDVAARAARVRTRFGPGARASPPHVGATGRRRGPRTGSEPGADRGDRRSTSTERAPSTSSTRRIGGCFAGRRATVYAGRVPVSVDGTLADMSVGGRRVDLRPRDRGARLDATPRQPVRRDGRELDVVETAERTRRRSGSARTAPSCSSSRRNQWMPARARRRAGLVQRSSAHTDGRRAPSAEGAKSSSCGAATRFGWRSSKPSGSAASLADHERHAVRRSAARRADGSSASYVVVRAYYGRGRRVRRPGPRSERARRTASPSTPRTGPRLRRSVASASSGRSLYQLGSTPSGAFVDRFDLEVH